MQLDWIDLFATRKRAESPCIPGSWNQSDDTPGEHGLKNTFYHLGANSFGVAERCVVWLEAARCARPRLEQLSVADTVSNASSLAGGPWRPEYCSILVLAVYKSSTGFKSIVGVLSIESHQISMVAQLMTLECCDETFSVVTDRLQIA